MSQAIQPDPLVYPRCSRCKAPYVLRLGLMLDGTEEWAWWRDCKHRRDQPETVDKRPRVGRHRPRPVPTSVRRGP